MGRMQEQKWIIDHFMKNYMHLTFNTVGRLEYGYKYADWERTMKRAKSLEMMSPSWAKTAYQTEQKALQAEENGYYFTAADFYHRAALYYGRAMYWIMQEEKGDKRKELCDKTLECYQKMAQYQQDYIIERVIIPVEGGIDIPAILHLPKGVEKCPCILFVPGMDMIKEFFPHPFNNPAIKRGLAMLTIDGPGQGESLTYGNKVTLEKFDEAGVAAIDYLVKRKEINREKIAIMGASMGSLWAPRIAAKDKRIKACATYLACYLQKETMFHSAQPLFRWNYMYMSGIYDDHEFDEMIKGMTLELVAHDITCYNLLVAGEFDLLCPAEDTYRFFNMLDCPKELWMYANEDHGMGGSRGDFIPQIVDWLKDVLDGKIDKGLNKKLFIEKLG